MGKRGSNTMLVAIWEGCGFYGLRKSLTKEMDSGNTNTPTATTTEPRSEKVRRLINEVEEALRTKTPAQVTADFADFQTEFPKIFEMVLTRTYPRDILDMMLRQLGKMETGSTSQHNASVAVGGVLVDRFVKPQLAGVPPTKK